VSRPGAAWATLSASTPQTTRMPLPTNTATPSPTLTPSLTPTDTPVPTETAPAAAPAGAEFLPNRSFEGGWYHVSGIPELQVPNDWTLEWETGHNPLDPDPWNRFVRPESRVLSEAFLPESEHELFIWEGRQTFKVFKQTGSISFRFWTAVFLQPGSYVLEINFFPDLIDEYTEAGGKVWAPDPLSGEVRFIVDQPTSPWFLPTFGEKNTLRWAFEVTEPRRVTVGAAFRNRWAIENNGWFMDDWSLRAVTYAEPDQLSSAGP
jgi:hypothetical protein